MVDKKWHCYSICSHSHIHRRFFLFRETQKNGPRCKDRLKGIKIYRIFYSMSLRLLNYGSPFTACLATLLISKSLDYYYYTQCCSSISLGTRAKKKKLMARFLVECTYVHLSCTTYTYWRSTLRFGRVC